MKIALSLDAWTSSNQYAFLVIISHYMTNKGQLGMSTVHMLDCLTHLFNALEELLIDFQELIGEHSGENMAKTVWETLKQYGLIR